jgi:hypothetical protein
VYSGFLLDGTTGGKTVFAVTNTKTLTLTSTDNFNLTVPATGTAALLATANVFTTNQKINCNSTTALFVEQDGVCDNVFIVDTTNAAIGIGIAPNVSQVLTLQKNFTDGTTANIVGIANSVTLTNNADTTKSLRALVFTCTSSGSGGASTGNTVALSGDIYNSQTVGTWASATGISLAIRNTNVSIIGAGVGYQHIFILSNAGNVTSGKDFNARAPSVTSTGKITTHYGYYAENLGQALTTNSYALYIANQTGSVTGNYAIDVIGGLVVFNDGGDAVSDLTIEGDTATNLFVADVSADSIRIGTTTAGAIAEFDATEITFNETGLSTLDFRVESDNQANALFVDASADAVGINEPTPTAYLHLGAGTAAAGHAPLRFTDSGAGVLLATPVAGTVEFCDGRFYITGTAKQRVIDRTGGVIVATTTVASTAAETTLWTETLSSNAMRAGRIYKFHCDGIISNHSNDDDITFNFYAGGALLATVTPTLKTYSNSVWHVDFNMTVRTIGAGGTSALHGDIFIGTLETLFESLQALDTTAANAITLKVKWNTALAANTISIYQGWLELKN